eukprot:PhM_4_TR5917/c0_g1_i2/m.61876
MSSSTVWGKDRTVEVALRRIQSARGNRKTSLFLARHGDDGHNKDNDNDFKTTTPTLQRCVSTIHPPRRPSSSSTAAATRRAKQAVVAVEEEPSPAPPAPLTAAETAANEMRIDLQMKSRCPSTLAIITPRKKQQEQGRGADNWWNGPLDPFDIDMRLADDVDFCQTRQKEEPVITFNPGPPRAPSVIGGVRVKRYSTTEANTTLRQRTAAVERATTPPRRPPSAGSARSQSRGTRTSTPDVTALFDRVASMADAITACGRQTYVTVHGADAVGPSTASSRTQPSPGMAAAALSPGPPPPVPRISMAPKRTASPTTAITSRVVRRSPSPSATPMPHTARSASSYIKTRMEEMRRRIKPRSTDDYNPRDHATAYLHLRNMPVPHVLGLHELPHKVRTDSAIVRRRKDNAEFAWHERKRQLADRHNPEMAGHNQRQRQLATMVVLGLTARRWEECRFLRLNARMAPTRQSVSTGNAIADQFLGRMFTAVKKVRSQRAQRFRRVLRVALHLLIVWHRLHVRHEAQRMILHSLRGTNQLSFVLMAFRRFQGNVCKIQRRLKTALARRRLRISWGLILWYRAEHRIVSLNANRKALPSSALHKGGPPAICQAALDLVMCPSSIKLGLLWQYHVEKSAAFLKAVRAYEEDLAARLASGEYRRDGTCRRPHINVIPSEYEILHLVTRGRRQFQLELEEFCAVRYPGQMQVAHTTSTIVSGVRTEAEQRVAVDVGPERAALALTPILHNAMMKWHRLTLNI